MHQAGLALSTAPSRGETTPQHSEIKSCNTHPSSFLPPYPPPPPTTTTTHRIDHAAACVSIFQGRPVTDSIPAAPEQCSADLRKQTRWGVATASYQVEGGWNLGGRTPSVWDTFSHDGFIKNNDTGKIGLLWADTEQSSRKLAGEQNWWE